MLTWHYVSSADYNAADASLKTADKLYFLSDTKQIYRGTELFDQPAEVVSTLPITPAVGRIYFLQDTLEGKIYNGTEWQTVVKSIATEVTDIEDRAVSGSAVFSYVEGELAPIQNALQTLSGKAFTGASYAAGGTITFTYGEGKTSEVVISDLPADLAYDKASGLLQLKNADGTLGTGINLDLERFVKSGSYDPESGKITLVFNDDADPVEIDASALVDTYTGEATSTATTTVSADNKITVDVKVSAEGGNRLEKKDDGLFVEIVGYATNEDLNLTKSQLNEAIGNETTRATSAEKSLSDKIGEVTEGSTVAGMIAAVKAEVDSNKAAQTTKDAAQDEAIDTAQMAADSITAKVGEVPTGKTVVQMIEEAQTSATYDDTQVKADIKANTDAIATLNGDESTDGSVKKALADAKAYTDEKDAAMDTRVENLEDKAHEHANITELGAIEIGDKAKWDQAVTDIATATAALEWKTTV